MLVVNTFCVLPLSDTENTNDNMDYLLHTILLLILFTILIIINFIVVIIIFHYNYVI